MRRSLVLLAAGAVLATAPGRLAAQTFQSPDSVIRRIWTLGMDSSHTPELAQALFDSIGPRLTGTVEQRHGNDWLLRTYRACGIEAKNQQHGGNRRPPPTTWPECTPAPRSTKPRLK